MRGLIMSTDLACLPLPGKCEMCTDYRDKVKAFKTEIIVTIIFSIIAMTIIITMIIMIIMIIIIMIIIGIIGFAA